MPNDRFYYRCIGLRGGQSRSSRKAISSRANGRRGGRPVGARDKKPRASRYRPQ